MKKYYTRACNFFYGRNSRNLVKKKLSLPLCGDNSISFNQIEILSRNNKSLKSKIVNLKEVKKLSPLIRKKILQDIKKITTKREFLNNKTHVIMGVLNVTPDSFSDGGKFNTYDKALNKISSMIRAGADIIDIGGESTRPGSITLSQAKELNRVKKLIEKFKRKFSKTLLSIDSRKSLVIKHSIRHKADIINDVSCFKFDPNTFNIVKNRNLWKIIHHMQGTPQTMQINPKYNNVLLDIYDFFENEIKKFNGDRYKKKLILDPGIGFGKNLKHNLIILNNISLFHSLGYPILIGTSRKRFINQISGKYDTKERIGGTLSSIVFSYTQGVKIFRVHNVEEVKQGLLVFKTLFSK